MIEIQNPFKRRLMNACTSWNQFWFAPVDLYNVGLMRMLFGFALFFMYWQRWQNVELFYYNSGLLRSSEALSILPDYFRTSLPVFFHSDIANYYGHLAYLILLFLFAIGIVGRWGTWALCFLSLSFMQRNFPLVYGADLFSHFWLFYLSFINHNKHWSVLNLRKGWKPSAVPSVDSDFVSSAFIRLIQIQLCLSYAYTGLEKFKGTQWWDGTAVWTVIGMQELVTADLTFLRNFPILIALISMSTVLFEVYFIFAVWSKKLRPYWLVYGFMFHFSTAILMTLWFFCSVMVLPYLLFLNSYKLRQLISSAVRVSDSLRLRAIASK